MSNLVALTLHVPEPGFGNEVMVNLDNVTLVRQSDADGSSRVTLSDGGQSIELSVQESPSDIRALAQLPASFRASDWTDAFSGRLTGFELAGPERLTAALVENDTGALVTFALRGGAWQVEDVGEPVVTEAEKEAAGRFDAWSLKKTVDHAPMGLSDNRSAGERMAEEAARALNTLSSKNVPYTKNGRLACAWAVNVIAKRALGHEIGGGLRTADMYTALVQNAQKIDANLAEHGDVLISPTQGGVTGHVGIVVGPQQVASNSSTRALFMQNYTISTWYAYFVGKKKLGMHVFRLRDHTA